jgi:nucleoside-diphosphate kinase
MSIERTYVMLKPDAVRRSLAGSIVSRFENSGLKMEAICHINVSSEQSGELYKEHDGKPFYKNLISYIHSGPVIATVWAGPSAVSIARKLIGATNPAEAAPGTIRGDFGLILDENVIHGSDSVKSAEREIPIFFPDLA